LDPNGTYRDACHARLGDTYRAVPQPRLLLIFESGYEQTKTHGESAFQRMICAGGLGDKVFCSKRREVERLSTQARWTRLRMMLFIQNELVLMSYCVTSDRFTAPMDIHIHLEVEEGAGKWNKYHHPQTKNFWSSTCPNQQTASINFLSTASTLRWPDRYVSCHECI
jgi:hypothetical protein